jgi:hypothetical protein
MTLSEVVDAYYTLQKVEHAFREMKDFLRLRPVHHYREHRVRAHAFICVLAYLLGTTLEVRLREAGVETSARKALSALATVHVGDNRLGQSAYWSSRAHRHRFKPSSPRPDCRPCPECFNNATSEGCRKAG